MENEKRLIDANPIVQFIENGLNNPDKMKALGHDAIEILAEIEFAPTVDAVEVIHSRAVLAEAHHIVCTHKCERCAALIVFNDNYCPNCGAKMDGKVEYVE